MSRQGCDVCCNVLRQVDEIEVQGGSQVRAKVGSMQDGTVITVQGHGIDVSPVWRHAGMAFQVNPLFALWPCCSASPNSML